MFTSKCGKCTRLFERSSKGEPFSSQQQADQAKRMHENRVHGGMKPRHQQKSARRLAHASAEHNHAHGPVHAPNGAALLRVARQQPVRKARVNPKLQRKAQHVLDELSLKDSAHHMNHCPNCGLNLKALAFGMVMAIAEGKA